MFFAPMPRTPAGVDGDPSAQGQHADAQPGSLYVEGLQLQTLDAGGGAPLNSFLEAALPPRSTLLGLELYCCSLGAPPLQRLPAIARLESLDVGKCQCTGSMAATLRALVQAAPALTGLRFNVGGAPADDHSANRLRRWPAYLLAHPSLRCLTLLDCGEFEQGAEQPLLPS